MTATLVEDIATTPDTPNLRLVLAGLMAVMGLAVIDANIVNTALPRIVADLGGMARVTWAVTAFLLASTIAAPLYGKLSDLYGRRRLIIIAVLIFLLGSLLCGIARSMTALILFRAVQGLGAGGLVTLVQATIGDLVKPAERARYQAFFTLVFAVCSLAGPLIGGALTTYFSWRWVFYVNLPLGALALTLIMISLPSLQLHERPRIDFAGAALLTISTIALLTTFGSGLAIDGTAVRIALLAIAIVTFLLLIRQERRAEEPMIDLALFRNRTFAIGVCTTFSMSFALMAAVVLLPLYLQLIEGETPIEAAMIVTPQVVGMILSSFGGARLSRRIGRTEPLLLTGVLLQAIALWGLVIGAGLALPSLAFSVIAFLLGAGMGMGMPNAVAIVQNAVRRDQLGVATGALSFFRSLGGAAGVALSGGVLILVLRIGLNGLYAHALVQHLIEQGAKAIGLLAPAERQGYFNAYRHAIQAGFGLCAVVISLAVLSVTLLPKAPRRPADA